MPPSAIRYPTLCLRVNQEIARRFSHESLGAADHFFKPFWWVGDLNEFDTPNEAKIDLRSLALGEMTLHKTPAGWKIDPAWIAENSPGLDRINNFLSNLQQFESRLLAEQYKSPDELLIAIDTLTRQFNATIPQPPLEP
jgi:hypothetical protein